MEKNDVVKEIAESLTSNSSHTSKVTESNFLTWNGMLSILADADKTCDNAATLIAENNYPLAAMMLRDVLINHGIESMVNRTKFVNICFHLGFYKFVMGQDKKPVA